MKKLTVAIIITVLAIIVLILFGRQVISSFYAYDILIKGGQVYDGSTAPPVIEDIGIKGDKIVAIGKDLAGSARRTIDAKGSIVTPGFIDVHNHTDLALLMAIFMSGKKDDLSMINDAWRNNHNYSTQGVTTIVTGLCGAGFWDTRQWLGLVDSQKFASNVYHLIPYGMLRQQLFGNDQPTALTGEQLEKLKAIVEKEMRGGAIGLTVGLEYAPTCFTTTDELVEIAKVVSKYGGLYDAHIRDQTGAGELKSIRETIEIAQRAKIPVHISHIQLNLPWGNVTSKQMMGLIEQARAEGVDITADQHPYAAGYAVLSYRLPPKYKTGTGVNEKYKNPAGKAEMIAVTKKIFTFLSPEKISLTDGPGKYRNKTIKEIADIEGKDPAEVYVELSCLEPAPYALFFEISDQINREIMPHDYVFTASDGFTVFAPADSPHPRFFGCFPRKIRKYALEDKLLSLNDAIRSMTSLPAKKFKLKGRGEIKVGKYADIAVIDLANFKDNSTYAERSLYSEGVEYLLVNGKVEIDQGKLTGKRGGHFFPAIWPKNNEISARARR
ncbi:MAG: amidohydrolase family protein [Candidatus Margulisbacteria bacterium]|nr:amidohydrolase family protein [Candidatus Margulisiibacteriota bacterium]